MAGKDTDLDIRELFKVVPASIKEGEYSLDPKLYIEGRIVNEFKTKKDLLKQVFKIANRLLTER
jgi:hypothetical protein